MKIVNVLQNVKKMEKLFKEQNMSQELENHCGLTYGNHMSAYACATSTAYLHLLNSICVQSCSKKIKFQWS